MEINMQLFNRYNITMSLLYTIFHFFFQNALYLMSAQNNQITERKLACQSISELKGTFRDIQTNLSSGIIVLTTLGLFSMLKWC